MLPRVLISRRFSIQSSPVPIKVAPSQLPFIAEVKGRLENGSYKLQHSSCPCADNRGVVISEIDRYALPLTFVLCTACGTVRIDPYLDPSSLEDFYARYYQQMYARAPDHESYFLGQRTYGEKLLAITREWLKPTSWVFEVGCGAGGALHVFQQNGNQVAGCDYSAELIAAGVEHEVNNLYVGSLKDLRVHLPEVRADLIYVNHVFEHINNPLGFLEECRTVLTPGGRIIISVPDVTRIDRYPAIAGSLLKFLHIAHKYNFSLEGLTRLGRHAGYQVRRLTPPKIQTSHSHIPELWVELTIDETSTSSTEVSANAAANGHGAKMLKYLRRTEKLYALGLCRGQLLHQLSTCKRLIEGTLARAASMTPAKVIRKLRGIA